MMQKITGWNNGLSQDYNRQLFNWFASRLDTRYVLRCVCYDIERFRMEILKVSETDDFVNVFHSRYHIQTFNVYDNKWETHSKFDSLDRAENQVFRLRKIGLQIRIVDIEA